MDPAVIPTEHATCSSVTLPVNQAPVLQPHLQTLHQSYHPGLDEHQAPKPVMHTITTTSSMDHGTSTLPLISKHNVTTDKVVPAAVLYDNLFSVAQPQLIHQSVPGTLQEPLQICIPSKQPCSITARPYIHTKPQEGQIFVQQNYVEISSNGCNNEIVPHSTPEEVSPKENHHSTSPFSGLLVQEKSFHSEKNTANGIHPQIYMSGVSNVNMNNDNRTKEDLQEFWNLANRLRKTNILTDLHIVAKDKNGDWVHVPAHKIVMVCGSEYFKCQLQSHNCIDPEYFFSDLDATSVGLVMDYLYEQPLNWAEIDKTLVDCYRAAREFRIAHLCELFADRLLKANQCNMETTASVANNVGASNHECSTPNRSTPNEDVPISGFQSPPTAEQEESEEKDVPINRTLSAKLENDMKENPQSESDNKSPYGSETETEMVVPLTESDSATDVDDIPQIKITKRIMRIKSKDSLKIKLRRSPIGESKAEDGKHIRIPKRRKIKFKGKNRLRPIRKIELKSLLPRKRSKVERNISPNMMENCAAGEDDDIEIKQETVNMNILPKRGRPPGQRRKHWKEINDNGEFYCKLCGKCYKNYKHLKLHYLVHEGTKNHKCKDCGKRFTRPDGLYMHMTSHRPHDERPHKCQECNKRFNKKHELKSHYIALHSKEKPFQCEQCGKSFPWDKSLKEHLKIHDPNTARPFVCDLCHMTFRRKYDLQRHLVKHSDTKPFTCDLCGRGFTQLCSLTKHKREICIDNKVQESKPQSISAVKSGLSRDHSTNIPLGDTQAKVDISQPKDMCTIGNVPIQVGTITLQDDSAPAVNPVKSSCEGSVQMVFPHAPSQSILSISQDMMGHLQTGQPTIQIPVTSLAHWYQNQVVPNGQCINAENA